MATKKRSKPKKRTYKSTLKESRPARLSWKKPYREWESSQEELPERVTVENSCWRFQ
jgi:hypothetical protein